MAPLGAPFFAFSCRYYFASWSAAALWLADDGDQRGDAADDHDEGRYVED